jgi:hypothetical protein
MSQDKPNLSSSISNLGKELAQPQPTEKTQAIADDLRATIEPILQESEGDLTVHYKSLGERLNLALVDLDVDHPSLSAAIRTVLDELAAVGI